MKHSIAELEVKYTPNKYDGEIKKITNSNEAYQLVLESWNKETLQLFEEFKVIMLNNSNEVLGIWVMSKGGMTGTAVDVKLLFSVVLKSCAAAIITVHNHPSGNLQPSESDSNIYEKMKSVASFLDVRYLDNLIITKDGYYSFMDN